MKIDFGMKGRMTTNYNNSPVTNNYFYVLSRSPLAGQVPPAVVEKSEISSDNERILPDDMEGLLRGLMDRIEALERMLAVADDDLSEDDPSDEAVSVQTWSESEAEVTELSEEKQKALQAEEKAIQRERMRTDRKNKKAHQQFTVRKSDAFAKAADGAGVLDAALKREESDIPSDDDCVQFDTTGMVKMPSDSEEVETPKTCMTTGCSKTTSRPEFDHCFTCWRKRPKGSPDLDTCQLP